MKDVAEPVLSGFEALKRKLLCHFIVQSSMSRNSWLPRNSSFVIDS